MPAVMWNFRTAADLRSLAEAGAIVVLRHGRAPHAACRDGITAVLRNPQTWSRGGSGAW